MSWSMAMAGLTAISLLIGIANTVWVWLSRGEAETQRKLETIEESVRGQDARIRSIEGELKHLPTQRDVHDLTIQVTEVNGKLKTFDSELGSVARTVRRIEGHLLGDKA